MSADNGLIVRRFKDGVIEIFEYNASSGSECYLTRCRDIEDAVKWAQHYQTEHLVEYGISFDLAEADS